jgi:hypothetical protein
MGRVYYAKADPAKGELPLAGRKVATVKGIPIALVYRVEFDEDADEGLATVGAYVTDVRGNAVVDYLASAGCEATFRTWVRVWPAGADPVPTPNMRLWKNGAGGVIAMPADPFPAVPFEKE